MAQDRAAEALERALLPAKLPDIPGWSIATLYEPAGDQVLVGGDFYDWFCRPDGSFAFLLGDVAGKGQVAATVGMAIRKGLKALSWAVPDVREAVRLLERALADELAQTFASFCYLELGTRRAVRILSAGHPPPWIVRAGGAHELVLAHNGLFGVGLNDRWTADEVDVEVGDLLLVFSDGLTEARIEDGRLFGEGILQALLDGLPTGLRPWELAMKLSHRLDEPTVELRDDLVVTVLQRTA